MGLEKLSSKKCKLNELWQDEAMDRSALKDGGRKAVVQVGGRSGQGSAAGGVASGNKR